MAYKRKAEMRTYERIFIYMFVFLNSITGIQIGGKSLNVYLVILFLTYVAYFFLRNQVTKNIKIPKTNWFLSFNVFSMLSCLFSLFYVFSIPHESVVQAYLINSLAYTIAFVLLYNCTDDSRYELANAFKNALILTAVINVIWGVLQVILEYVFLFNINQWLFEDILHATNDRDWVMGFFTGSTWNIRMTGLNFENSMFAIIVCIGLVLVNNKLLKAIMTIAVILSLSRTGWVMLLGYYGIQFIRYCKKRQKKIKKSTFSKFFVSVLAIIVCATVLYNNSPIFMRLVNNVLVRVTDSDAVNISGARHLLYYPYGVLIWLFRSNPLQQLLGYGMRCSGVPFSENPDLFVILGGYQNYTSAWAVECDVIGLLLGGGFLTFLAYYINMFKQIRKKNLLSDALWIILIGGITYHYHSISFIIFILLVASVLPSETKSLGRQKSN